jgi:membrane-associated phospholipid phosphatase
MRRFFSFCLILILNGSLSAQMQTLDSHVILNYNLPNSVRVNDTLATKSHSLLKSAILPASLMMAGIIVETLPSHIVFSKDRIQMHILDKMNGFTTNADNYLQFVPMAALFSFKLAGMKSRNDLMNQAILTAKSELLMLAIVNSMKYFIHDMRPDGSSDNSMPSGHTAQAFVSATLLDMEYRETSPWISIGGYLCATATGLFRVANNRHWVSDVMIGAGIGIASVKVVYLTHRNKWGKTPQNGAVIVPMLMPNGGGLAFAMKF